jgi:hypothetical protein
MTKRIMIVDDDAGVRRMHSIVFRNSSYNVEDYNGEASALKILREAPATHYNVILTDLAMEGPLSGLELATEANTLLPNVPVIIISGTTHDLIGKILPQNIKDVLIKPIGIRPLIEAVERAQLPTTPSIINYQIPE